jgi:hypothetical protein
MASQLPNHSTRMNIQRVMLNYESNKLRLSNKSDPNADCNRTSVEVPTEIALNLTVKACFFVLSVQKRLKFVVRIR